MLRGHVAVVAEARMRVPSFVKLLDRQQPDSSSQALLASDQCTLRRGGTESGTTPAEGGGTES